MVISTMALFSLYYQTMCTISLLHFFHGRENTLTSIIKLSHKCGIILSSDSDGTVSDTAYANTFMRREIKYLLTEEAEQELLRRIRGVMTEDVFSRQTNGSLYCDSPDGILIRTSLLKPEYKQKVRLRTYNTPDDDSVAFLEIKKKYDGVVYKRRVQTTYRAAMDYLVNGIYPECTCYNDIQVMQEIDWLVKRFRLAPATAVFYDRTAFHGNKDTELRLTLDRNIRYRTDELDLRSGTCGIRLRSQPHSIMEVKSATAFPIWLTHLLEELSLFPGSFSKYGEAYRETISNAHNIQPRSEKYV